ncbi:MAG: dihydrolipoyl dehydrogenase [Dongia sp.]
MADTSFDVVILGGGPGGYVAAIRAAQLKMNVAVVERENLGGICLNWGCIPTKALLRSAEVYHNLKHADAYGLVAKDVAFDFQKVVDRSRKVSKQLTDGVKFLMKKNKITVFDGSGKLNGPGKVKVEKDGKLIWTYREALLPNMMPKSLLVVGSGAIGIEFASFFRTLGAEVTVVEVLPRILPVEDTEISAFAHKAFEKQGMKIKVGATVKALKKGANSVTATIESNGKSEELTVDRVIMAVGIVGNVENIGIEGTKVKVEKTHVVIDGYGKTGEPGVYAIGDLAGPPWLAHKAMHEGVICVEAIAGVKGVHPMDTKNIPGCTYCMPQVASVGLTEEAAKAGGREIKVGKFPFIGNGKAIALGEPDGLVKTIFDAKTGELLGAHMIGAEVTELIQGYTIAKTSELTEAELMATVFPHPTLSEMMHEAVLAAYGRTLHM